MRNFALKMRNFVFKMMKMMKNDGLGNVAGRSPDGSIAEQGWWVPGEEVANPVAMG